MKYLTLLSVAAALISSVAALSNHSTTCTQKDCAFACHHVRSPKALLSTSDGSPSPPQWFMQPLLRCAATSLDPACIDGGCTCYSKKVETAQKLAECIIYRTPTEAPADGKTKPHEIQSWKDGGATVGKCCSEPAGDGSPSWSCNIGCGGKDCAWFKAENVTGLSSICP